MSNTIRCDHCHQMVARGRAHIRSRCFQQVGWCDPCWVELHPDEVPWIVRVVRQVFGRAA